MLEFITAESLIALLTLTALEIALGIDNIVFIAILTGRLPERQRPLARRLGLLAALVMRVLLLLSISWLMGLTEPWFGVLGHEVTGKDLILLLGGLFLIGKSTYEIHHNVEHPLPHGTDVGKAAGSLWSAITQIMLIDVVFSLDSVITAVGMAEQLWVMIVAVVVAIAVMMAFADRISAFIEAHPTLKVLALSFLILIGVLLVAEGAGQKLNKGYIYFAMAFSLGVELLNLRMRRRHRETAKRGEA